MYNQGKKHQATKNKPSFDELLNAGMGVSLSPCGCGCGTLVKGRFKQGHDQRHKGNLLRSYLEDSSEEAFAELLKNGWYGREELVERLEAKQSEYSGPRCKRCGLPLRDPQSIAAGFGPICQSKLS